MLTVRCRWVHHQTFSFAAIKPHFAAFHTIISDECDLEPSLSLHASEDELCHPFVESETACSFFDGAHAICSRVSFHSLDV